MPQLIIEITEEQREKMINHFNRPINVDEEDTPVDRAIGFSIYFIYGWADLNVLIDSDELEVGVVETNFWDVLKHKQ